MLPICHENLETERPHWGGLVAVVLVLGGQLGVGKSNELLGTQLARQGGIWFNSCDIN
jgi:hypothetical protein